MNTSDYRTRTIFKQRKNLTAEKYWPLAIDAGYSAVKGLSSEYLFCFPSYAKRVKLEDMVTGCDDEDILYRKNGECYLVGKNAQNAVSASEANDSENDLYGRRHYFNGIYGITFEVGIAVGLIGRKDEHIKIRTGLPPKFLKEDAVFIRELLEGEHSFDMKLGKNPWQHVEFTLEPEDISIISQPLGTLFSITTDNEGNMTKNGVQYFKKPTLILDPGFVTLDAFLLNNKTIESAESFTDLGMKRVFSEVCNEIYRKHKKLIPVYAFQKYLEEGSVNIVDRKSFKNISVPIKDILEEKSTMVCMEAISRVRSVYDDLQDISNMVISGGTGAAWSEKIREVFRGRNDINIVSGNENDNIPYIFNNARGYYLSLVLELRGAA